MKDKLRFFFAGVCSGVILVSGFSFAAQYADTVQRFYDNIKITLNGKEIIPKDVNGNVVEPFKISGTTYLPVRAICNALGLNVDWDGDTNTVILRDKKENEIISGKVESDEEVISNLKYRNISLFKYNDEYYIIGYVDSNGMPLGGLPAYCKDDLIFSSTSKVFFPDELFAYITLATFDDLTSEEIDNPYLKKIKWNEIKINGIKRMKMLEQGKDETIWYSASHSYTPTWIKFNGIKIYNHDEESGYEIKNDIRYFEDKICVNDVFKVLGIDKKISFGEYEGLTYIEIKND